MSGTHILASTPSPAITDRIFVFHIDVILLSLFAIYAALTLPHTLVHLFQPSEILNSFFLHSGSLCLHNNTNFHWADMHGRSGMTRTRPIHLTSTRTNQTMRMLVNMPEDEEDVAGGVTMAKNKNKAHAALITPLRMAAATTTGGAGRHSSSCQSTPSHNHHALTRVPRCMMIVHLTLVYTLNFCVSPSFSFGKLFVLIIYAVFMLYTSLRHSNPFTDPMRTGYVAMLQIPIAIALARKTNWLSWASGVGYEKACGSRSSVAYASFLNGASLSSQSMSTHSVINGTLRAQLRVPKFMWALIALCAIDLLFAFTLSFVRNRMYTLFFSVHVTGVTVFLLTTYKHSHTTLPYILAAVGFYIFDHLACIAQTRYTMAWLTTEHALNSGTMLVHIPSLGAGWAPELAACCACLGIWRMHVLKRSSPTSNVDGDPLAKFVSSSRVHTECLKNNAYDTPLKKGPKPL
ncbi:hypothetical protein F5148DRAFT_1310429 [Russula earlei]|uniref:Uncharacterized protein n=1 Tax=Russula earlei TaxID=71964 RepID=A0ACC0TS43_9AGAM|nr:hypothetical protein F5148DRAFT_1310429 [Russula earlei]